MLALSPNVRFRNPRKSVGRLAASQAGGSCTKFEAFLGSRRSRTSLIRRSLWRAVLKMRALTFSSSRWLCFALISGKGPLQSG